MDSAAPASAIEAPFAVADQAPGQEVDLGIEFEFDSSMFLDLGDLQQDAARRRPTSC